MSDFTGKRYLVTGAASGIGHATAELLLAAGAEVISLDRNVARAPSPATSRWTSPIREASMPLSNRSTARFRRLDGHIAGGPRVPHRPMSSWP
jgi:NAD(P)-dependent dehydrogenase (short-subunit alcohol dehydrogenase family)